MTKETSERETVILDYQAATPEGAHTEGQFVVVRPGAVLPQCCIKCAATTDLTTQRRNLALLKMYYIPGLTIFSRTKIPLTYSICGRHRMFGWLRRLLLPAVVVATVLLVRWAINADRPGLQALAGIAGFAGYIVAVKQIPTLRVSTLRGDRAWLVGAGPAFMASLPAAQTRLVRRRRKE